MQRLCGHYSIRSKPVEQLDWQITPKHFKTFSGYKLPIRGPFTQVLCDRGSAVLYVSQPGEVPLYYSITPGWIHWHEQRLALPGKPIRINQGEVVLWNPKGVETQKIDELPCPAIEPDCSFLEAIKQYKALLIQAIAYRLPDNVQTVAVSQSGGIDSLMITWGLLQLGIKPLPLTVCTGLDDPDISVAQEVLPQMGAIKPIPILITQELLNSLVKEALLCFEDADIGNIKMAIGNLLMARTCQEQGMDVIFNGHAQDDLHGVGGLALGTYRKLTGPSSERWRDARRKEVHDASGMVKMFASTFRRYGVQVRMPYYDADLLEWAFSQPTTIISVHHAKPFARAVACSVLPPGPWLEPKYNSTGYITGAGLYEDRLRDALDSRLQFMRDWLRDIKTVPWQEIANQHLTPASARI
jgi:asparagine synthetase B (glutamine-hydrolysing)